jgi:hypothetical protein
MYINFLKNIAFTKLIKTDNRLREFNFRKLPDSEKQGLFHVDVSDDRGNRIVFHMKKESADKQWKISTVPVPQWIQNAETKLHEQIEIELQ